MKPFQTEIVRMPKFKVKGPPDPYLDAMYMRQYGIQTYGTMDRLQKRMGEDLMNMAPWYGQIYSIIWDSAYTCFIQEGEQKTETVL